MIKYTKIYINPPAKELIWLGQTYKELKLYPADVKREIGYNLDKVQQGLEPADWKSMVGVGQGVHEMRIHADNEYRMVYVAKFPEAVYVLHSFIKKTQKTPHREIEIIKTRYLEMLKTRAKS